MTWLALEQDEAAARDLPPLLNRSLKNMALYVGHRGDMKQAVALMTQAYQNDEDVKDGFAGLAEVKIEARDWRGALALLLREYKSGRMTLEWQLELVELLKIFGDKSSAEIISNHAYTKFPRLRFKQAAWNRFFTPDMAYDKMLPYLARDYQDGLLDGEWMLRYADALAVTGREGDAGKAVEEAYAKYPELTNGFTTCGYHRYYYWTHEPDNVLPWIKRDIQTERLQGRYRIFYASVLAAMGELSSAKTLVKNIYADDASAVDGYATIGLHYAVYRRDPEVVLPLFEKDAHNRQNTPGMNFYLAGFHAHHGNRNLSEKMVHNSYQENKSAIGNYCTIGFCDYARNRELDYLLKMVELDNSLGRLDNARFQFLYAAVLLECNEMKKANAVLESIAHCSILTEGFARTWLMRATSGSDIVQGLFRKPELNTVDFNNTPSVKV